MKVQGRGRRAADHRVLVVFLLAAAPMILACSMHHVEPAHGNTDKVYVCHKDKKTLEVADDALAAHLSHGDSSRDGRDSPPANTTPG